MILIQEHKIIEDERSYVNSAFAVVFIDDAIELLHELCLPYAQFRDDFKEEAESSDPFFFAFAELRIESKADPVLLLVL